MKKIYFLLPILSLLVTNGFAQYWSQNSGNIYPTTLTDSVGVGLNNPNNLFQVKNLIEFNTSSSSTFIGDSAGVNNTGIKNTFLGFQAGKTNSSGYQNVFLGYQAGLVNSDGFNDVFIGQGAGESNTSGASNTFIGRKAGKSNTTASANTFIGKSAGFSNTLGSNNTGVGTQALRYNIDGSYNMALGNNALQNSANADSNTVLGFGALGGYNHIYSQNVVIGFEAGNLSGDMKGCVLIGSRVGLTNSTNNRLMIDNSSTSTPLIDGDFANDALTVNGTLGLSLGATVSEFSTDGTMADNSDSALCTEKAIVTYVNNTISSSSAWSNAGNYLYQATLTDSVGVGLNNPNNLFQVKNLIEFNTATTSTFIGDSAGVSNTGAKNSFFGYQAGKSNTSGYNNTFLGYQSGLLNTIGYSNVFIGQGAGQNNTTGVSNTFIGRKAGSSNTTASANTFIGKASGFYNTTGTNNTAIGTQALKGNTTGSYNMALGNNALQTSTAADSNVVIGFGALGALNNTYRKNVVIGWAAGNYAGSISGCVLIGNNVGESDSISNRLMIDNSSTNTPLIDGDFTNDVLTINNVLKLTPRATVPSNPVAGMMYIDSSDGNKLKVYDGTVWHSMW